MMNRNDKWKKKRCKKKYERNSKKVWNEHNDDTKSVWKEAKTEREMKL